MTFNLYSTVVRPLTAQLLVVSSNGSTILDVTPWLESASTSHSDQSESHKASFTLANPGGLFDPFSNGTYSTVVKGGALLKYSIIIDSVSYPAYYGSIQQVEFSYSRGKSSIATITCLDPSFKLLKANITSSNFTNQQINLIVSDLLLQYGNVSSTDLYPLDFTIPTFQCPTISIMDAIALLYGIVNYFFWFDYSGAFQSFPRVGNGYVGMPDATFPPTPNITLPDNALISSSAPSIKIYDTINQIRVIGEALTSTVSYGPIQKQSSIGDPNNFQQINNGENKTYIAVPITSNTSGSSNQVSASGVYLKIYSPGYSYDPGIFTRKLFPVGLNSAPPVTPTGAGYQYMTADPTAVSADTGIVIPLGPIEYDGEGDFYDSGANKLYPRIYMNSSSYTGKLTLNQDITAGLTSWQTVNFTINAPASGAGGGFEYYVEIWGKTIILQDTSVTVFLDYDPTYFTRATCLDVFGDHKTYQVLDPANIVTTLHSNASEGASTITVTSSTGLLPSDSIIIGTGSDYETQNILNISGNVLTLTSTLAYAHTAGETVQTDTTIQPLGMSAPIEIFVNPSTLPASTLAVAAASNTQAITLVSGTGFTPPLIDPISIAQMNNIRIGSTTIYTTSLNGNASSGASSFVVNNATGLAIGDVLGINLIGSANYETVTITNISGTTIDITPNLANNHVSTETVVNIPVYEYAVVSGVNGNILNLSNPLTNSYGSGTVVQGLTGVITADGVFISDLMQMDFEQGRLVFDALTYNNFLEDSENLGSTGTDSTNAGLTPFGTTTLYGNAKTWVGTNNVKGQPCIAPTIFGVSDTAPIAVYNNFRQANGIKDGVGFKYNMTGFEVGRGYTVRLHFYEHYYESAGNRVFNVYLNGSPIETDFDIWQTAGLNFQLVIQEYTGINPTLAGNIELWFVNGELSGNGSDYPIVSCIEIIDPQGIGGALPEINSGGAAITPTPPIVEISGCYSQNQRTFGLKSTELNNPLLSTVALCQQAGQYDLNTANWSNYPIEIVTATFPTITPASIIKFFNPFAGPNGCDQWMYVQAIDRITERTKNKATSYDTYKGFLLYSQARA